MFGVREKRRVFGGPMLLATTVVHLVCCAAMAEVKGRKVTEVVGFTLTRPHPKDAKVGGG